MNGMRDAGDPMSRYGEFDNQKYKEALSLTSHSLPLNPHILPFARTDGRDAKPDIRQQYGLERVYHMANNENPLGPSPRVDRGNRQSRARAECLSSLVGYRLCGAQSSIVSGVG